MRIIVYSETTASSVGGNLGRPEYSYFFILNKYLPCLSALGEVCPVDDPASEVDVLYAQAKAAGTPCVFLSFTPPHRTARDLACPTVCVLAWEFDNIPSDDWDPQEPWQNWVKAIREIGNVITISDYATRVIKRQVGRGPRVVTIPAPVDPVAATKPDEALAGAPQADTAVRRISVTAAVFDTHCLDIDSDSVTPKLDASGMGGHEQEAWNERPVDWGFSSSSDPSGQYLVGFYGEEDWGSWSKTARPSVIFPWALTGPVEVDIELVGYGSNQGRAIGVHLGTETAELVLQEELTVHRLVFSPQEPVNNLYFSGLSAMPEPGARDHRTLGLGLSRLRLRRPGTETGDSESDREPAGAAPQRVTTTLSLAGAVYASVFNPADGRKNWLDIVTAFVWAFREDPNKTLLLKMSHHNRSTFLGDLFLLFSKLAPFNCRVVAIHGYLSDEQLASLTGVTDYFVNASVAEGQCLPLLEFMARGVPAVSPDHTAMESYINSDNAFVVRSSQQPHIWPNDPREAYRTLSNRIDWDSLRQAYEDSARVLEMDPPRYRAMAVAARAVVEEKYASEVIRRRLRSFLGRTARPRGLRLLAAMLRPQQRKG